MVIAPPGQLKRYMASSIRHDDIVLAALIYRRNVGATLDLIRTFASIREAKKQTAKDDKAALARLAKRGIAVQVGNSWFLTPEAYRLAKGTALSPRLKDEDAWILLSLLYRDAKKPSRLEDIIASADSINHAIPGLEETHGALNRLDSAGLIKPRNNGFIVTKKALDLYTKMKASCTKNVLAQLDGLQRIINCPCCGPELKAVRWRIVIRASEYHSAVESYSMNFR